MGRGVDILVFSDIVAEENMRRMYDFRPQSINFFVNMDADPIEVGESGNKLRSVDLADNLNVIL